MKKPKTATSTRPETVVVIPASTGEGVTHEVDAADVLNSAEHQNDDMAGDRAAAEVTRPVVAVGAVVEPVNPALATEPAVTGDAAGDAAIQAAGAGPEVVQPIVVTTIPSTATVSDQAFSDGSMEYGSLNNSARSTTAVEVGAGDLASPAASSATPEFVLFDLTRPATQEERDNFKLVLRHLGSSVLNEMVGRLSELSPLTMPDTLALTSSAPIVSADEIMRQVDTFGFERDFPRTAELLGDWRATEGREHPVLRITSKIAGFRRGGIAHPAEPVDYPVGSLQPHQIEAFLDEPQLVTELI